MKQLVFLRIGVLVIHFLLMPIVLLAIIERGAHSQTMGDSTQ
jgi:hypothetical protein